MRYKFIALLALALVSCAKSSSDVPGNKGIVLTKSQQTIVEAGNDVTFKILPIIGGDNNYIFSPFSLQRAMGMAINGAGGGTYKQIASGMGWEQMHLDDINGYFKNVLEAFQGLDSGVNINVADAMFMDPYRMEKFECRFKSDYTKNIERTYKALAAEYDFSDPSTLPKLNAWASEKTANRINSFIDEIEENTVLFLANAISFDGRWEHAFDSKYTKDGEFYCEDGQRITTPMMSICEQFRYYDTDNMQALLMNYGNGAYSMVSVLPSVGTSLQSVLEEMSQNSLNKIIDKASQKEVDVALPKFSINSHIVLTDIMMKLGIIDAFTMDADFHNMYESSSADAVLHLDEPFQKASILIEESGVAASSLTVLPFDMDTSAGVDISHRKRFTANRPFVFFIRENSTGAILFAGVFAGKDAK